MATGPTRKGRILTSDPNGNPLRLDDQLCFAVYAAAQAFNRLYRPLLARLGLTYPQYLVLLVLWEQDGLSLGAIGDRLGLDSGTLTPLLRRLEGLGLVRRRRGRGDERRLLVGLTPRGTALRHEAEAVPPLVLQAVACSDGELAELRQALWALRGRLLAAAAPF